MLAPPPPTTTQMNTEHLQMLDEVYNMLDTPNLTLSPDKIASYRELLKQGHVLLLKGGSVEVIDVDALREAYTSAKMSNDTVRCATAACATAAAWAR
jgi:predicted RNA-binding protein associated with RNAse of E/G family